jgi:hypothetical protein
MSNYAKIENGIITNVIICEDSDIMTQSGLHVKSTELTGEAIIGGSYDEVNNKMIAPKPYDSWTLNEDFVWVSPAGTSPEGMHTWNEQDQEWVAVVPNQE